MPKHHKELQDKLLLEMFDLIEQSVLAKTNVETSANNGYLLLAKTRYTNGSQCVATSKLPTEDSNEFSALSTVSRSSSDEVGRASQLELVQQPVDRDEGFVDPLKWFGVLIPNSLQLARDRFNKSLDYVIESANIQLRLHQVLCNLIRLKSLN